MNRTTLIAAVFALLVVTTGVAAAVPGNAPVDADENGTDERTQNGVADRDAGDRDGLGPDVSLPDQVPEHVSAIHDRIASFLDGDLAGSLGDAISDLTPGGDETGDADESGENDADEGEAGEESDATDDGDE